MLKKLFNQNGGTEKKLFNQNEKYTNNNDNNERSSKETDGSDVKTASRKERIMGGLKRVQSTFMSSMSLKRNGAIPDNSPDKTNQEPLDKSQKESLEIELGQQKQYTTWNLPKKTPLTDSGTVIDREVTLSRYTMAFK